MSYGQFFQLLYGNLIGKNHCLSLFNPQTKANVHCDSDDFSVIEEWLEAKHDVYFGLGLRRPGLNQYQRGKAEDVVALPGFWLDIDIGKDGHRSDKCPPSIEEAFELLDVIEFHPTLVVSSGYGIHIYFLFDRPLEQDFERWQYISNQLQYRVIEAGKARGWHIDNVGDMARVLRVPGTKNFKIPDIAKDVHILYSFGHRYTFEDWYKAFVPIKFTISNIDIDESPKQLKSLNGTSLSLDEIEAKARACGGDVGRMLNLLFDGQSIAEAGDRDKALTSVAGTLASIAPFNSVDELLECFKPMLLTWSNEEDAEKTFEQEVGKVREKLTRFVKNSQANAVREAGILEMFDRPIKAEDKNKFLEYLGCTEEQLAKLWIIYGDRSYWLLTDEYNGGTVQYIGPKVKEEMNRRVRNHPHIAQYEKFESIVMQNGTAVNEVKYSLMGKSGINFETGVFNFLVRPIRTSLKPVYNKDVDEWLKVLGGKHANKLLDWLATVSDLNYPTCAIYLSGPPNTGKSLFINGVASLWTETGQPTELHNIIKGFNYDLIRCPLIAADEDLPVEFSSTELRKIITSYSRTLTIKYHNNTSLEGCIRLILAANNKYLLTSDHKTISQHDYEAFCQRFLHVDTLCAQEFFNRRGGSEFSKNWISDNVIANHILWLEQNRKVERNPDRFLVTGNAEDIINNVVTNGKWNGLVTEWLAKFLASPHLPLGTQIIYGKGKFLVNAKTIENKWNEYIDEAHQKPIYQWIGRTLGGMSFGEIKIDGIKYHSIKPKTIIGWAEENMVGDPEKMWELVNGPEINLATGGPDAIVTAN